ncbi:MAG: MaoC family dehydratase [Candidatus Methylomirabilales bacterium]
MEIPPVGTDGVRVGDGAEVVRTITEEDLVSFATATGDVNPLHFDEEFAQRSVLKGRVVHGMLTASLIATVLGTKFPGPGTVYLHQEMRFLRPVRVGDTVTARVEVTEVFPEKGRARLATLCQNQRGEAVLEGTATVLLPNRMVRKGRVT